jgi:aromatic-L-amino-acid decarboxylase
MNTENIDFSLELPSERMLELVNAAMKRIVQHLDSLPQQPAYGTEGGAELAREMVEPVPESAIGFEEILDLLFERLVPKSFNTAGPGYLAYIPGGGLFHSALADLIAGSINRYVGVWAAAPALAQLETNVVRWFSDFMGYPSEARGFLSTGGSISNLSALVTARHEQLGEQFLSGTLYVSDQTHHSVLKAARLAGLPDANVRAVESDEFFRIRKDRLVARINEDRQAGLKPFLIVGSAGTTNTGAVDDLEALADIARHEELWFHVDAAYGGFFMLTERGRRIMKGIDRADTIALDPHKGLFLPYGTGALLARDGKALKRAHSVHGTYMPPMQDDPQFVDFCEISPELSRDFRGLRVWLPLKLHGVQAFRNNLNEKLDLADWACNRLKAMPGMEVVAPPELSLLAFCYAPEGTSIAEQNILNRALLENVNRRKNVYLTSTVLEGRFVLRICILSFRTHLDRMETCIRDIEESQADLAD